MVTAPGAPVNFKEEVDRKRRDSLNWVNSSPGQQVWFKVRLPARRIGDYLTVQLGTTTDSDMQ